MTFRWRVWSGLALVLTMIGSPMASALCALTCPDVAAMSRPDAVPNRPMLAAREAPGCHEAALPAATEASSAVASHAARSLPPADHRCDPRMIVSTARGSEGLRVLHPTAVLLQGPPEVPHVAPLPARLGVIHASRAPSPPRRPAAVLVLRI